LNLIVENINKQYKDNQVLKDVSFELTPGVYGLLGANGSSKTTLMRILASVTKPTTGKLKYNQVDISVLDEKYREVLGYMPQHLGFYKNYTAEKFLRYIASLKGMETAVAKEKVVELLELVNLTEKSHEKIKTFSGGMERRLGIAQALLNDPKVLIVDEPTAGIDPKERIRFRNMLSNISSNRIVLLSTHIVTDIEYIAKEIMILKDGQLLHKKDPETLLQFLEDKVWMLRVSRGEVDFYKEKYKVGNIVSKGEGAELRIISENKVHDDAVSDVPNLEDLYLYYFDEVEVQ